jgi:mannose-6-phosphate isomerase-like protein (cupin superfamily)
MPPTVFHGAARRGPTHSRAFIPPNAGGWSGVALMEWELTAQEWIDEHPHDEFNYVLEGTLMVSCDGETVQVAQGEVVRVPAGSRGRYWAPEHARMLAVYGPNPDAEPSTIVGLRSLDAGPDASSG